MADPGESYAARWWIATGRKQDNGKRVLGPFDNRELALEVRALAERAWRRDGAFWVVTGDEIPERSITPGFFDRPAQNSPQN